MLAVCSMLSSVPILFILFVLFQSASKGKGKKKKWSKGKMREKRDNKVVYNKNLYEKTMKEIPKKMKVITVYALIEAYKINGSLARRTVKELLGKGACLFRGCVTSCLL